MFILSERTGRDPVTKEADKNEGSVTDKGKDSNDSWDLDTILKDNPKVAAMMNMHKSQTKRQCILITGNCLCLMIRIVLARHSVIRWRFIKQYRTSNI